MVRRNMQRASQSRVFTIEDRAGPSHLPVYQVLARVTGVTWGLGAVTPIRVPDPKRYGSYIVVDKIKGQVGLPTASLEVRSARDRSALLSLAKKGCPIDLQVHVGACKDPSDFDLGWEKILVLEDADFTNYSLPALGAFDADQEAAVMETLDLTASDMYEVSPLAFSPVGESQIVQEVVDVLIADARTCGACGLPSDGCQRVFAVQKAVGASPGLPSEIISSQDGESTWQEANITPLPVDKEPSAIAASGPYLVVVSHDDDSIHYAEIVDLLDDTATWVKVTSGIEASGSPVQIFSLGRTQNWIVGDGGYVYFSDDVTVGVEAQTAGDVTSEDLKCVHGMDEANLIAAGANNAILLTRNGGQTWVAVAGPGTKAAVTITACWMMSENEWILGYADGTVFYTIDGGGSWAQMAIPGSLTAIDDIQFSTRSVGYIAGRAGAVAKLLRTISGGKSWYVLPEAAGITLPSASQFNAIAACGDDPNVVFAGGVKTAGGDGIIVKGA